MKPLRVSPFIMILFMIVSCVMASSANAYPRANKRAYSAQPKAMRPVSSFAQPTLDDAVKAVQSQTGGRVLSARKTLYEGSFIYEIKVMREGRVEVIRVPSLTSD